MGLFTRGASSTDASDAADASVEGASSDGTSSDEATASETTDTTAKSKATKRSAARARPPRVILRPAELKESNQLSDLERKLGYGLAAYGVGIYIWRASVGGIQTREWSFLVIGIILAASLAGLAKYTNRVGVMFAAAACAILCTFSPSFGPKWQLLLYPFLMLTMVVAFRSSQSRRKIMARRVEAGDLANPHEERRAAKAKPALAKEDATGRAYANKSKRYTPPKASKKK